ncbi:MAG: transposase [Solirubrobacteraceae bacterium]
MKTTSSAAPPATWAKRPACRHRTPPRPTRNRLRTAEGAAVYAQRSHTVEPVFGHTKHNRQMRGFRRRGLPAAKSEWALMHLACNMHKLRQHRAATATA